jgi:hypothetical protein
MTKRTKKITNKIFAIPADAVAIPEKPSAAAIIATTRKITAHVNIRNSFGCILLLRIAISIPYR